MIDNKKNKRSIWIISLTITIFFIISINVSYATQILSYRVSLFPNDTQLDYQYYLDQVEAIDAWDIVRESPEVIVAVIDSGVDIEHPDLVDNIWHNPDEIKDGIDNDNNGYIDDIVGWDFILNSPDPKPKFGGQFSNLGINHGTVVAGIIGAIGDNNFGLAGISWRVKIMPLKVMNGEGVGQTSLVYQAIKYAISQGADVINLSMVGDAFDPLLDQVIEEAYQSGIVIVASAGNETDISSDEDSGINLTLQPQYPVCHDGGFGNNYVLGVGSVNTLDVKSKFSNYGSRCIDLVAPGESFYGTLFFSPIISEFNQYFGGYWSGTSLTAPQVSATAALVKALRPDLTNQEIYDLIINNTDDIDDINLNYQGLLGSGRLNIYNTISEAGVITTTTNLIITPASQHLPTVQIFSLLGQELFTFLAYSENFLGGVNITTVDLDNDGQKEIITAAGSSGGPHIRLFKVNGELIGQFFAYDINFTGGVNVVSGDIDGDGEMEIITSPQSNYPPQVKIFDLQGNLKKEFLAFDNDFTGGVNLALSDINADGVSEIVTGAGSGGSPLVKIFTSEGLLLKQFFAYPLSFSGGVKVASYNFHSDLRTEILTSPQSDQQCQIRIFSPSGDIELLWSVWGEGFQDGCNLTAGDLDDDNLAEVIVSKAKNGPSEVIIFNQDGSLKNNFTVLENDFTGGINIEIE